MPEVKNRLAELIKIGKITKKELAQKINVNPRTITRWERGESPIPSDKAEKLAELFGVPIMILLGTEYEIAKEQGSIFYNGKSVNLNEHPELKKILKNQGEIALATFGFSDYDEAEYETDIQMSEFDNDFIEFLKNHDIYLSDSEIEKVINIMYSYSNANDFYLSSLVRSKDLDKIQKEKEDNFSNLFKYSSFWKQNIKNIKK